MDRAADGAGRLRYLRRHSCAGPVPSKGMATAGWPHGRGVQRSCPGACHPASQHPSRRGRHHPSAHTGFEQPYSKRRAPKMKGREFPESQGKSLISPSPRRHSHLLNRGTHRPRLCMWPRLLLMLGFVQPRSKSSQ